MMKILQKCYTLKRLNFLLFLVIIVSLTSQLLHAQTTQFDPIFYYEKSINLQKSGMLVLGSWAGLNIISGIGGNFIFENERKYFFQMNAAWNVVNLGIATFGYLGAGNLSLDLPLSDMVSELQKFDRILLINAGLDLIYLGTGGYLLSHGLKNDKPIFTGYGHSILLQGGFLFLFDVGLLLLHSPNTQSLTLQLSRTLAFTPTSITVYF